MKPVLEIQDLERSFGKGESKVRALRGVSFTVNQGEFVAIMGPSGSGKSTMIEPVGLFG